jgi:hypothetical protein
VNVGSGIVTSVDALRRLGMITDVSAESARAKPSSQPGVLAATVSRS